MNDASTSSGPSNNVSGAAPRDAIAAEAPCGDAHCDALRVIARRLMQCQHPFAGYSLAITAIRRQIAELAALASPVLITGERGAGKSTAAAQLHLARPGPFGPFVVADGFDGGNGSAADGLCSGSGAPLEKLSNATLVIDNVESLADDMRSRLFGMLPTPGTAATSRPSHDALTVAITSRWPLDELRQRSILPAGWIEAIGNRVIDLPPLRRRIEDIEALVACFAGLFLAESPRPMQPRFGAAALKKLRGYDWPGNVRQLRAVVETAVDAARSETVSPFQIVLPDGPDGAGFAQRMSACEKALLVEALISANYRQTRAAELLGMTYDQFRHYFKKYDLRRHTEL